MKLYILLINMESGDLFVDGIDGHNEDDALQRAYSNWDKAEDIHTLGEGTFKDLAELV